MSKKKERGFGTCVVCGQPLLQRGGFANTGMGGPCCTGEADTIDEVTEEYEENHENIRIHQ